MEISFFFEGEGEDESFYYQPDTTESNIVTLYSDSDLSETVIATVVASDACNLNPMYPTGTGAVQVTILGCCDGLPNGEFAWDTENNPSVIASGGNADIYVSGGCPPYTYSVSGTGATWNDGGGTSLESSNTNEQLDVAGGT